MGDLKADLKVRITPELDKEINRIADEMDTTRSSVARDLLDIGYMIMAASRDIDINLWSILRNEVPEQLEEIEKSIEERHGNRTKN